MEHSGIKLLVGLGNPGKKYQDTFHNAGFLTLQAYAGNAVIWKNYENSALVAGECPVLFLPQTYMNCSGEALRRYVRYKNIALQDMLVICDDFSIKLGCLRIRKQGSSGGQKGLKSIIDNLGSGSFPRLRVGIGPLDEGDDPSAYVLGKPSGEKAQRFGRVISAAADAVRFIVDNGIDEAMNKYNSMEIA